MIRFLLAALLYLLWLEQPVVAQVLSVGAATIDITPPVGFRHAGGYTEVISTGVHNPLSAKAIVVRQGTEEFALVISDRCRPNSWLRLVKKPVASLTKVAMHTAVLFASQTVRAKIKPVDQVRYQQAVEMFESLETVEVDFMSLVASWRDMHAFRYLKQYGDEGKPLGSYEVTTCPLAPGCGELMIQTASHLLDQLKGTQ